MNNDEILRFARNVAGNGDPFRHGDIVCVADSKHANWFRVRREEPEQKAQDDDEE
jgi:hypothetical protein